MSRKGADDLARSAHRLLNAFCRKSRANVLRGGADSPAIAVALSGGADSTALAHVVAEWHKSARGAHSKPIAIIVDHNMRAESADEATTVAERAYAMGLEPVIAQVCSIASGEPGEKATQRRARIARYSSLHSECLRRGVGTLLTGHTEDDQIETFLLRAMRCSGECLVYRVASDARRWLVSR